MFIIKKKSAENRAPKFTVTCIVVGTHRVVNCLRIHSVLSPSFSVPYMYVNVPPCAYSLGSTRNDLPPYPPEFSPHNTPSRHLRQPLHLLVSFRHVPSLVPTSSIPPETGSLYVSVLKRQRSSSGHRVDWRTGVDCQHTGHTG